MISSNDDNLLKNLVVVCIGLLLSYPLDYRWQPLQTKLHSHGQRPSNSIFLQISQLGSTGWKYMYEEHPPVNKQIEKNYIHFPLLELTLEYADEIRLING